jgi:hypothetical protein
VRSGISTANGFSQPLASHRGEIFGDYPTLDTRAPRRLGWPRQAGVLLLICGILTVSIVGAWAAEFKPYAVRREHGLLGNYTKSTFVALVQHVLVGDKTVHNQSTSTLQQLQNIFAPESYRDHARRISIWSKQDASNPVRARFILRLCGQLLQVNANKFNKSINKLGWSFATTHESIFYRDIRIPVRFTLRKFRVLPQFGDFLKSENFLAFNGHPRSLSQLISADRYTQNVEFEGRQQSPMRR